MQSAAKILAFFCVVGGAVGEASLLHTPHHGSSHHAAYHSTPHHGSPHRAAHHSTPHHGSPHHVAHHSTPHHAIGSHTLHHSKPHHTAVHHDLVHHGVGHHGAQHSIGHHGAHHSDGHHIGHHAKPHHAGHHHGETYHNSPAQYGYDYAVHDEYSGAQFGHSETRDGYKVDGTYYVHLPDGRVQTVQYYADETGYHPQVVYEGTPTYHQEGHHHANPQY